VGVETVTVMFTDLVDSTALLSRLGEDQGEVVRREHFGLLRAAVGPYGGREVKNLGDGLMVVFSSAANAVSAAVRLQQEFARRNRRVHGDRLLVRVGISCGDADTEDGDYFGVPVVEAARLCANAGGGEALATEKVRLLAGTRGAHTFTSMGELDLKGLERPVVAHRIEWEADEASAAMPPLPAGLAAVEATVVESGVVDAQIRTPDQRLRVFVSSTLGELADERHAARASVEQLRLTPVMFEIGARPHPPRALYRSYLAQSDVFVGIYWQRYGWVAPDMDISGLEDELVLSQGMPRLLYVKRPADEMEPRLAEMLARLEGEGTASYKPFSSAAELQSLLSDDLAVLLTERFGGTRNASHGAMPRHNLPAQTSTFIGRETELGQLGDMIEDSDVRLITLRGAAGTGKTRLAIRVAFDWVDRFADGVFFVDLSAEREADGVFAALARAVAVAVPSGARPLHVLTEELRDRQLLIILDNFEQVMPAAVDVVAFVAGCPGIKVLVTSREALRVRGEYVFAVRPLSLPEVEGAAADSEAVRLFCDRAAAVRPGFALAADNTEAIADICHHLDGLPLAIELAAARMQLWVLHVEELRTRLIDRLDVLRGGARDLPKRQQTLGDAMDWSYDLLDENERQMFRLFAAFATARLDDVEEAASRIPGLDGVDVLEMLGSLVDKSLVRSSYGSDGRPRLSMLRTIRAYALERLDEDPEFSDAVRLAHAQQYTEVASRLQQQMPSLGRGFVLAALADELVNMQAAWSEWVDRDDVAQLNRMLTPLWGYYDARGDYRSAIELGSDLLQRLAASPESPQRRRDEFAIRMSVVRTELAVRGYTAEAEHLIRDALEQAEAAGDAGQRFSGLRSLGYLHHMNSDFEGVGEIAGELLAMAEADQDPLLLSEAHLLTGLSRSWQTGLDAALESYEMAVEHAGSTHSGYVDFRVGTHPAVVANVVSALTQWMVGSPETARSTMQRSLDLAAELDHPYSLAYATHHASLLDMWGDDIERLKERTDALEQLAEAHDYPVWRALALVLGGLADVRSGSTEVGLTRGEKGFELYRGVSAPPVFWPALLMIRATTLGAALRPAEALAAIQEAETTLRDGDPMAPDIGLVHADLLLAVDPPDPVAAEITLGQVDALASSRGCRMARVQALTRLADLRRGTAMEHETIRALREVYADLTEGSELPQLAAARNVLEERAR
jgi:predicted ATPase/class 3 adenylate cyclase